MKKQRLLDRLFSLKCAVVYDIFAQISLHEFIKKCHCGEENLSFLKTKLPEGEVSLEIFFEKLSVVDESALVETKRNANRFLVRNYLKEVYRMTESYCYLTQQKDLLKGEPWYKFTRVFVNCISHSGLFEAKKCKEKFPIYYKGVKIAKDDNGKPINVSLQFVVDVVEEILDFTRNKIG